MICEDESVFAVVKASVRHYFIRLWEGKYQDPSNFTDTGSTNNI